MFRKLAITLISVFLLSFNANAGSDGELVLKKDQSKEIKDCFEKLNRATFAFNQGLDKAVIKPIAESYRKLPDPIQSGTSNAVKNLSNLITIPNNVLQGNFKELGHSTGSFLINTSIGVLGFLNPAAKIGLKPHKEDVGQTLATYGIGSGCYFVLPILGPTTVRDSVGMIADTFVDPFAQVTIRGNEIFGVSGNNLDYLTFKGTDAVEFRSENLTNFSSLEKNSLDLYSSVKSIYLQDRKNKINNSIEDQDDWGNLDK